MKRILLIISLVVSILSFPLKAQERIKMTLEGGVYTMPCEINGLTMKFIFDTGASSVSMSLTEALFMLKNGYLEEDDIKGTTKSQIANGELMENVKVNLKSLKIGSITLNNISATIMSTTEAPLLLGMSVLNRLGSWTIENGYLILNDVKNKSLNDSNPTTFLTSQTPKTELDLLNERGEKLYESKQYKDAVKIFRKAAYSGHPGAQLNLARCFHNGNGVKVSFDSTFYWASMSAQKNYAEGQAGVADAYYNGEGIKKNIDLAVYWAEKSANQGCAGGMFVLANILMDKKEYNKAVSWYKEAANKDNVKSQCRLGIIYYEGNVVIRDYQEARYWFELVAKQEKDKKAQSIACFALSEIYYEGYGVEVNYQKAAFYLLIAAEYGLPVAQYNLGLMYYSGEGVPQSQKEAKSWFKKAAKQGHKDASIMLDEMF